MKKHDTDWNVMSRKKPKIKISDSPTEIKRVYKLNYLEEHISLLKLNISINLVA